MNRWMGGDMSKKGPEELCGRCHLPLSMSYATDCCRGCGKPILDRTSIGVLNRKMEKMTEANTQEFLPRIWIERAYLGTLVQRLYSDSVPAYSATRPDSVCWISWDQHAALLAAEKAEYNKLLERFHRYDSQYLEEKAKSAKLIAALEYYRDHVHLTKVIESKGEWYLHEKGETAMKAIEEYNK